MAGSRSYSSVPTLDDQLELPLVEAAEATAPVEPSPVAPRAADRRDDGAGAGHGANGLDPADEVRSADDATSRGTDPYLDGERRAGAGLPPSEEPGAIETADDGAPHCVDPTAVDSVDDGPDGAGGLPEPRPLPVEVIRSAQRRRTVSARIVDGRIVVRVPARMSARERDEHVATLVARLERQRSASRVDLMARARELARHHGLPRPSSIRFVSNQSARWGSCTPSTSEIRISDRIAAFPRWVVDAVVVHELAHLVHLDHSPAFWELANRYAKMERAHGFLSAMQLAEDGDLEP